MPPKIRDLKARLRKAGFVEQPDRGRGSHSYWSHPTAPGIVVVLSGQDGDDAYRYHERQVAEAIRQVEASERERPGEPGRR